eukprot:sb/3465013/
MFIELQLSATLESIESFTAEGEDFRWYIKAKCSSCGEEPQHFIYVAGDESTEVKGGRGTANLVVKCKMCNRENSISIVDGSVKAYTNETGQFQSVVRFECRGMEPTDFSPRTGWTATAADSGTIFTDVDLQEKEWCDYDEKEILRVMNETLVRSEVLEQSTLVTYNVVPITTNLGVIEWLPNTVTLKSILETSTSGALTKEYQKWIGKMGRSTQDLTSAYVKNGYVDRRIQKGGVPGVSGCVEHFGAMWETLKDARIMRRDLSVVWLDLANAYGAVPHLLIAKALRFYRVPQPIVDIVLSYFSGVFGRFSSKEVTSNWQQFEVGIFMGCVISVILFVLCMNMVSEYLTIKIPRSVAYVKDGTPVIRRQVSSADFSSEGYARHAVWQPTTRMQLVSERERLQRAAPFHVRFGRWQAFTCCYI